MKRTFALVLTLASGFALSAAAQTTPAAAPAATAPAGPTKVAVVEFQGLHQIYLAGSDGKAHLVTVDLGPQVGTNWLVNSGVTAGSHVIVDNLQKLRDGAPVAPHTAAPAAVAANSSAPAAR